MTDHVCLPRDRLDNSRNYEAGVPRGIHILVRLVLMLDSKYAKYIVKRLTNYALDCHHSLPLSLFPLLSDHDPVTSSGNITWVTDYIADKKTSLPT